MSHESSCVLTPSWFVPTDRDADADTDAEEAAEGAERAERERS